MTLYQSNRDRLREFKRKRLVAGVLKYGALITLALWLLLALMAGDQGRDRLTESVKQLWPGTESGAPAEGVGEPPPIQEPGEK